MNNIINRVKIGNVYTKYTISLSNLALIKWEPKCSTDIHNHEGKNCNFIVLNGDLHENRYTDKYLGSLYSSKCVEPLTWTMIKPEDGYHEMFNYDDRVKYSIHRYYD
tara:strand:+ start:2650 stop:2970 length:321 start_codon:yes stop_codon:yes gene_type:complete